MFTETEKERTLLEMNRNLRRVLFHVLRQQGGTARVRQHELVKYAEAGESLRWRTDLASGDIVLKAEYLLDTPPAFSLGEGEQHLQPTGYRVIMGEVTRTIANTVRTVKDIITKPSPPPAPDKNPKK